VCKSLQCSAVLAGKWFEIQVNNTCSANSCAFLNFLTMGSTFPCVPAAFQQWGRRAHFHSQNDPDHDPINSNDDSKIADVYPMHTR